MCTYNCQYCGLHCPDCALKINKLDVIFVIDTSDSMLEGIDGNTDCDDGICKLIDAKAAVQLFIQALNFNEDRVGIVEFNAVADIAYGDF